MQVTIEGLRATKQELTDLYNAGDTSAAPLLYAVNEMLNGVKEITSVAVAGITTGKIVMPVSDEVKEIARKMMDEAQPDQPDIRAYLCPACEEVVDVVFENGEPVIGQFCDNCEQAVPRDILTDERWSEYDFSDDLTDPEVVGLARELHEYTGSPLFMLFQNEGTPTDEEHRKGCLDEIDGKLSLYAEDDEDLSARKLRALRRHVETVPIPE